MNATTLDHPMSTLPALAVECAGREEWLEVRRSLIGASDTAGIFGVGYEDQSALTVWDEKVNARPDEKAGLKRLRIGKLMEPALRAIASEEIGLLVDTHGEFTVLRHAEKPWLGATLDGFCIHPELGFTPVELKNVSNFAKRDWEDEDLPLKFAVQCQQQIAVTGARQAFLFGLIGGSDPVVKLVPRNQRFIDAMIARLEEFWGYVERREMPPVDESLATARLLTRLFPEDDGSTIMLPAEATEWAKELADAKSAIKEAEAKKVAAENKIKAAINDNSFGLLSGGGGFSWKTQSRAEHVVKASTFRVLRACK